MLVLVDVRTYQEAERKTRLTSLSHGRRRQEMDGYRLYTVVPYLVKFIDQLTNIYVRYNRKRLKGKLGDEDTLTALCTLYTTLLTLCKARSSPLPLSPSPLSPALARCGSP